MAQKNAWFKHYNNASNGHTLSVLWSNNDTEAIALFWLILELVSRFEDESKRGFTTISWSTISRETGWKPSKCRRVLARISPVSKIEINEEQTGYVSFLVPNWLNYQENRGGKKSSKMEQNSDRGEKREERGKNKEIIIHTGPSQSEIPNLNFPVEDKCSSLAPVGASLKHKQTISIQNFQDFNSILSDQTKSNLFELYPDFEFLKREFLKMHTWLIANPARNKKSSRGWSAFVANWLDRSWGKYTNGLPSNKANFSSAEVDERISKLFGEQVSA